MCALDERVRGTQAALWLCRDRPDDPGVTSASVVGLRRGQAVRVLCREGTRE